ncbi:uncharacterized protein PFL1_02683 [Pseudozyma flocculosa PF-1]|uniref:Small ribosomal subunit protein uS10m n=2 Tax=Pseudozyma flocculosa TaxID=84751 RepID=A0A5C3EZ35_9BASI|nr:uncharacterized protein PFL1_02683 [Pseudozyma flocculosa PF-1]EPQ30010.1 hypothetical protein PFL1_02683 [Pseudozyma flocculosa PF-1]SPO37332.1 related to RSM10 - mitochondrial ribosomal protein, small subunit [Pseudozyma flocculosa]
MAFRCSKLALQAAAAKPSSSALISGASASSSSRVIYQAARTLASSSRAAAPAEAATLNQLRKEQSLGSTLRGSGQPSSSSSAAATDAVSASTATGQKPEPEFEIPSCLLPTETQPKTHGIHVATLHLRCYGDSLQNLDLLCDFARKAAFSLGIPVSGTAHLPVRTALWTVPRSPFVHKKSQENFWRKTHSRAIKVFDANDEVVDRWLHFLRIHALPGVGMKAELMRYHEVGIGSKLMEEAQALQRPSAASLSDSSSGSKAEAAGGKTKEQSAEDIKRIADDIVAKEVEKDGGSATSTEGTSGSGGGGTA